MKLPMGKTGWLLILLAASAVTGIVAWRWPTSPPAGDSPATDASPTLSPSPPPSQSGKTEAERLELFRKLSAAERKQLLDGIARKDRYSPPKLEPTYALVDGTIRSVVMSEIVCLVRAESPNLPAATIRSITKKTRVEMGEPLIELDDEPIKQRLKEQIVRVAEAEKALKNAAEQVARVQTRQTVSVQFAEIDRKLAKLSLNRYAGTDPQQKSNLEAASILATMVVEQTRAEAEFLEGQAIQEREKKKTLLDEAERRLRELGEDLPTCQLYAPRDGQVVFAQPLKAKDRLMEGQKILWVCDLDDMRMIARTDVKTKPDIALVRPGQLAYIRAPKDRRYPSDGRVETNVRQEGGVFVTEFKFIQGSGGKGIRSETASILPDTPATATVTLEEKKLMLPVSALLGQESDRFCYVLAGQELQERQVTTGTIKAEQKQVEVMKGLRAGDLVLVDPRAAVKELINWKP